MEREERSLKRFGARTSRLFLDWDALSPQKPTALMILEHRRASASLLTQAQIFSV